MLTEGMDMQAYPSVVSLSSRFGDMDADACVSDTALARYVEQARSQMITEVMQECGIDLRKGPLGILVAHVKIEVASHRPPDSEVFLASGVSAIGRSSVHLRVGVFSGGACLAVADNVLVLIARETGRPVPIPSLLADKLQLCKCGQR